MSLILSTRNHEPNKKGTQICTFRITAHSIKYYRNCVPFLVSIFSLPSLFMLDRLLVTIVAIHHSRHYSSPMNFQQALSYQHYCLLVTFSQLVLFIANVFQQLLFHANVLRKKLFFLLSFSSRHYCSLLTFLGKFFSFGELFPTNNCHHASPYCAMTIFFSQTIVGPSEYFSFTTATCFLTTAMSFKHVFFPPTIMFSEHFFFSFFPPITMFYEQFCLLAVVMTSVHLCIPTSVVFSVHFCFPVPIVSIDHSAFEQPLHWVFFAFQESLSQLSIFAFQQSPCPLTIFNKLDSWYICSSLRGVLKIWFEMAKHFEDLFSIWKRECHVRKILLALSLFTSSTSTANWLTCLLSLLRNLVLRTFVTNLSHMIHMLQLEGRCYIYELIMLRDMIW